MSNTATLGHTRLGEAGTGAIADNGTPTEDSHATAGEVQPLTRKDSERLYEALRDEVHKLFGTGQPAVQALLAAIAQQLDALQETGPDAAAGWKKVHKMLDDLEDVLEALMAEAA